MKNTKKIFAAGIAVALLAVTSVTALAASAYGTPAQALAGLTGRTEESVVSERQESGKTYGAMAAEAGKLAEFQDEMLELRRGQLAQRVADGTMTQARADEILAAIEANQAVCDGSGSARLGRTCGAGFGAGQGRCAGQGGGQGAGCGAGGCN